MIYFFPEPPNQDQYMQTLMLLYVGSGLLLTILAVPLIRRKIKPNGLYGFRTKTTMENPKLWYKVNEYSGRRLLVAGIGTMVASLVIYAWPGLNLTVDEYALAVLGVFLLFFTWVLWSSYTFYKSAKQDI